VSKTLAKFKYKTKQAWTLVLQIINYLTIKEVKLLNDLRKSRKLLYKERNITGVIFASVKMVYTEPVVSHTRL